MTLKKLANNYVDISSGSAHFKIVGMAAEEYPKLPKEENAPLVQISGNVLLEMIKKTQFAISSDETRYILNGVFFEPQAGGKVRMKGGQELSVKLVMRQGQAGGQGAQPTVATSNLQDVGFKVDLQVLDTAAYNSTTSGVFSPTCCNLANAGHASTFPDPIDWLGRWTTASIPPGERNFAFWSNPTYDKLVNDARVELDPTKRLQLLKDAQKVLRDEAPIIFTGREQLSTAWNSSKIQALPLTTAFSRVDPWSIVMK